MDDRYVRSNVLKEGFHEPPHGILGRESNRCEYVNRILGKVCPGTRTVVVVSDQVVCGGISIGLVRCGEIGSWWLLLQDGSRELGGTATWHFTQKFLSIRQKCVEVHDFRQVGVDEIGFHERTIERQRAFWEKTRKHVCVRGEEAIERIVLAALGAIHLDSSWRFALVVSRIVGSVRVVILVSASCCGGG